MEKFIRSVSFAIVVFFVVLGIVIGLRMDQTTIALLGGTAIGLLIATPCTAIITYLVIRNRDESPAQYSRQFNQPPLPANSLQYWVVPQTIPGTLHTTPQSSFVGNPVLQQSLAPAFELPPRRKFYLIGAAGEPTEIEPDATPDTDVVKGGW
ncbi:MAG: hypothetical protein HC853_04840 [Anaerolineae bacterium]|nr:hypothetical protein [Anaerolineae bacterium]